MDWNELIQKAAIATVVGLVIISAVLVGILVLAG